MELTQGIWADPRDIGSAIYICSLPMAGQHDLLALNCRPTD